MPDLWSKTLEKYLVNGAVYLSAWELAKNEDIEIPSLLEGTGIDHQKFLSPDHVITTAQHFRFIHNLIALSNDPAVGLQVGSLGRLESLGVVGMTMLCSPTIREALQVGVQFSPTSGSLGALRSRDEGDNFVVSFELPPISLTLRRYLTEDLFAAIYSYLNTLSSEPSQLASHPPRGQLVAQKIRFAYPRPPHSNQYENYFKCPLEFDANKSELYFDEKKLSQPAMLSNALAFRQCKKLCISLLNEMKEELPITREIRHHISRDPVAMSTPKSVAEKLGIRLRTLQRHLAEVGTSFTTIRREVLQALAQDLLNNPALTLEEVATSIGYSDASNFRRAFQSWTGLTPSQFREALGRTN